MNKTIIEIQSLNVWYNGLHALQNVNLNIPEHRITALIGASGSGKSTLFKLLSTLVPIQVNIRM
mgnify:CR=1 FL=1